MSGNRIAYLTRREHFSACHRLSISHLTHEENEKLYSKCANLNGHGHNYYVEVTIRGEVDPFTGMVLNLSDLKQVMQEGILSPLDHKCIDKDVSYFSDNAIVSTAENIAIFIWDQVNLKLKSLPVTALNPTAKLHEVKLWETEKNIVIYRGE